MDKTENDQISKLHSFNDNYQRMEELYDKLIILDYIVTNSGEQFFTFVCLSAWLLKDKCKIQLKNDINPEEYEDPNVYIYNILDALRNMGKTVEFSPNKLKQGYGAEVIYILNCFADKAIEQIKFPDQAKIEILNNNFDLSNFDIKDQNEFIEEDEEEEAKYLFENQQYTLIDDDDDTLSLDNELDSNEDSIKENNFKLINQLKNNSNERTKLKQYYKPVMKSIINITEWNQEFDQMLPQLKLANKMLEENGNNWRIRFDDLKLRNNLINTELNQCNEGLSKLELDVQKSLDRLESREKYVQQQTDALCNELLTYRSELSRSMENYQQINGGVISKLRRLAELNETIQKVKQLSEKREQSIVDKTPLLSIRKSLAHLKSEINKLNIQIGVALRNVLHHKLQNTIQKNEYNFMNTNQDAFSLLMNSNKNQDIRLVY